MVILAIAVVVASWIYCVLVVAASAKYLRSRRAVLPEAFQPISVLKPLAGIDEGLESNLRSFFEQDYPKFELLFAVRTQDDPAADVVRRLMRECPAVAAKLIVTGNPPYPHAKIFSLKCMLDASKHDLIVMSDSDIRVRRDFCGTIAAEFRNKGIDLETCPYRAVAGRSLWSRLEALGMNTDFHAGVLTAVMLEGMKFALGPTLIIRRQVLRAIGGIERLKDYVSEDFMLGRLVSQAGFGVGLSAYVVEHRIGSESMRQNFSHRLRWARTSRRSRPWGYLGQLFTHPLPLALSACLAYRRLWPLFLVTCIVRWVAARVVSGRILNTAVSWLLLAFQDLLGFAFWIAGFFGNTVHWRGRRYILNADGTLDLAA